MNKPTLQQVVQETDETRLNVWVATFVFGDRSLANSERFSTNPGSCRPVLQKLAERGVKLQSDDGKVWTCSTGYTPASVFCDDYDPETWEVDAVGPTAEVAVCKAALLVFLRL